MSTSYKTTAIQCVAAFLTMGGVLISGCQPKSGDPGPKGNAGTVGTQGPKGDAGTSGPKGDAGTANVMYSAWTSVSFTGSGTSYIGNLTAPKITQEMLDKADIRVYWSEGGRVLSLPYSETAGTTTYTVHQRFYVGRVELKASYSLRRYSRGGSHGSAGSHRPQRLRSRETGVQHP